MPITLQKPWGGKLIKGRDHRLRCSLIWDDNTRPHLENDVDAFYATLKASDVFEDEDAIFSIDSVNNPDQFIITDAEESQLIIWIKRDNIKDVVADTVKYCFDVVVVLKDGTEWPYILDYNIVFANPVLQETKHGI